MYDELWVDVLFKKILDAVFFQVSGEDVLTPEPPALKRMDATEFTLKDALLSGIAELHSRGEFSASEYVRNTLELLGANADIVILQIPNNVPDA